MGSKQAHRYILYSSSSLGLWLSDFIFNLEPLSKSIWPPSQKNVKKEGKPAPSVLQDAFLMKRQRECEVWGGGLPGSCINETASHDTLHRSSFVRIFNLNLGGRRCRSEKRKGRRGIGDEIWNVLFFPPGAWSELAKCWRELTAADMSSFSPDIYQPQPFFFIQ